MNYEDFYNFGYFFTFCFMLSVFWVIGLNLINKHKKEISDYKIESCLIILIFCIIGLMTITIICFAWPVILIDTLIKHKTLDARIILKEKK